MSQKLKNALRDDRINDFIHIVEASKKQIKIHKDVIDNRFIIIYEKPYQKGLDQPSYSVGGYYDKIDNCIYSPSFWIEMEVEKAGTIKTSSFDKLFKEFFEELDQKIKSIITNNPDEYKDAGIEKYNHSDHWKIRNAKPTVESNFIKGLSPVISLREADSESKIYNNENYYDRSMLIEYLNHPLETIEKYAKIIIDNYKSDLGLDLLIYDDQLEYLKKIEENKDGEFDNLYLNKTIYNSIKDIEAKTLNITINYNGKDFTFKFDYGILKDSLESNLTKCKGYYSLYDKVEKFLEENTNKDKHDTYFDFSNITSITYGKKVLYEVNKINKNIDLDNDEMDLELDK